jgi:hypothetical protein
MTTTQKNAISSPAAGLQVYDSTTNAPNYYNGTAWIELGAGGGGVTGSGTINNLPKWTGITALGNSILDDDGTSASVALASGGSFNVKYISAIKLALTGGTTFGAIDLPVGLDFVIRPDSVVKLKLTSVGRLLLGTETESTYLLDVNGTARVSGKLSVNTPTADSAVMEITSTTQGFLQPRLTTTQKNAISSPAAGLQVYDSTTNTPNYYNGTAWVDLGGGDTSIYTNNGTLTSNRTVSSGGFSLVFNPQTAFVTTLSASPSDSTTALVSQNTLSYASGFFSTNIGSVYGAVAGINLQTFAGSATFEKANLASGIVSVNSIDFSAGSATITMTQATGGIRAMTGHQSQVQYQGTNSGTITHAAISQNLGFYRPSAATGTLTITNAYSLLINDLNDYGSGFTFTNRWAIYQDGASDNNYFKGKVVIGSTNTVGASPLNVKNLPTSSAGLASGDIWNDGGTLKIV